MPLYARRLAEHYPDREQSPSDDRFIVLSGGYEVGGFHRIATGPSEGRWAWGAGLGAETANFVASGLAISPEQCRFFVARAFRRMLTRADLRERPDARPGPPRREPAEAIDAPPEPLPPYITIRSGELIVGLLVLSTHGPEAWSWTLTGVSRPDDADFTWHGDAETDRDAFDQIELAWARWTWWAGLESIAPLQRGG